MPLVCCVCSTEMTNSGTGYHCPICAGLLCQECRSKGTSSILDEEGSVLVCNLCLQSYDRASKCDDDLTSYSTALMSPASSLTSYESCVSSLGDILADMNLQSWENGYGALNTGQEHCHQEFSSHLEDEELKNVEINDCHVENDLDSFKFHKTLEETNNLCSVTVENAGKKFPHAINIETDPLIWIPPEPECRDVTKNSVADSDDDEYSDGIKWDWRTSLSRPSEECHSSYRFKEEREKAMAAVMNGCFRTLVRQLLACQNISLSAEVGESWLDIIISLSWEAATLIGRAAADGKPVDPGTFVKVKCIGSGSRRQSQVIKGLVFKKNAVHKHMPTKLLQPRLLLLRGFLGQHAGELSSFNSMEQERDCLKSIVKMIEFCKPNVVLVEKTVSRDVQDSILAEGITLVVDMKLPRLERIACCTGSQIFPAAIGLANQKLQTCDSFHIEKVPEEHSSCSEGGKCSVKTLMFFETFSRPSCCTILLKGANIDELKKVKWVMQHTVPKAFHLIQETSFLVDRRAIFCHTGVKIGVLMEKELQFVGHSPSSDLDVSILNGPAAALTSSQAIDTPICDEFLSKLHSDRSTLMHFGFKGLDHHLCDYEVESKDGINLHGIGHSEKVQRCHNDVNNEGQMLPHKDGIQMVLDPAWILVLLTSRCFLKKTVCKQSHLSRVWLYRDSDISLGQFLHDILLNPKHHCSTCGESPNAHSYSYTYQSGRLAITVKQLSSELILPGEAKGKLWMWTLCLKCNWGSKMPKHTRRVVMSSEAHGLSFGKFLELCISDDNASIRLLSCGHLLHRDCIQFYGLGSTVAMFNYSSIDIYKACCPLPMLEFYNPNGQEWLQNEAKDVLQKGDLLFIEIMNALQKIMSRVTSLVPKHPVKDLFEIVEMLKKEKSDFEASLEKATNRNGKLGQTVRQILTLNRLKQELLLELYVWDRRLKSLQLSAAGNAATHVFSQKLELQSGGSSDARMRKRNMVAYDLKALEDSPHNAPFCDEAPLSLADHHDTKSLFNIETKLEISMAEASLSDNNLQEGEQISPPMPEGTVLSSEHPRRETGVSADILVAERPEVELQSSDLLKNLIGQETNKYKHISDHLQASNHIPISAGHVGHSETATDLNDRFGETVNSSTLGVLSAKSPSKESGQGMLFSMKSLPSKLEDHESWVWSPFSEICKGYFKDLQRGYSKKFDFINSYTPSYLSSANELISEQRSRLHFPVDTDNNIVSVCEDEYSSMIACALASLQDRYSWEGGEANKLTANACNLSSNVAMASLHRSSIESFDLEGIHLEDLTELGSEGFFSIDSLLFSKALHPEVPLGAGKLPGKGKYLVICIYGKQFYSLRRHCCPSELDYISSLCRSKKWDAQGGKSGALFAKTLDDRFIIKRIQKTELHSFLKFGPEYFKHISHCLNSRSQTCLAKILGIYQVTVTSKNGKEMQVDLMVMENIFFGRNISHVYDLKGVLHSRSAPDVNGTLLDQNFVEDMLTSPCFMHGKTKQRLQRAIWNDTNFLTSINVMDYSLLLGFDQEQHEVVYGIVDYLRQYTWDKHLETWVKASLVVLKNELPTVVSPKEYKKRFRKFMSTCLLTFPDHWCSNKFFKQTCPDHSLVL